MPAKGHKPNCQCPICKRVRAKNIAKTAPKPKRVVTKHRVAPIPEPKKVVIPEPTFEMGQQVILVKPPKNIPAGIATTVEGRNGDLYKVQYRRNYFWVKAGDLQPR